jgi:hypothetical protein
LGLSEKFFYRKAITAAIRWAALEELYGLTHYAFELEPLTLSRADKRPGEMARDRGESEGSQRSDEPGTAPGIADRTPSERRLYRPLCDFCNQPFETSNPMKKYCKDSHRIAAAKERARLKTHETARRE